MHQRSLCHLQRADGFLYSLLRLYMPIWVSRSWCQWHGRYDHWHLCRLFRCLSLQLPTPVLRLLFSRVMFRLRHSNHKYVYLQSQIQRYHRLRQEYQQYGCRSGNSRAFFLFSGCRRLRCPCRRQRKPLPVDILCWQRNRDICLLLLSHCSMVLLRRVRTTF